MQKTPEDEAFDDLAKRQGAWGGGFPAKRQSAIDKIKADFDEEYIKYRVAFPKEYTAASVLGDQAKYGTSWSKDGERIDPMSVYKEPEQLTEKEKISQQMTAEIVAARALAQPAQEPVAWLHRYGCRANAFGKCDMGCTAPPQRPWVGLTDEERDDLLDTYITAEGRARAIEQALKEKNT